MEYKSKQQLADEIIAAWEEFWRASENLENALEVFQGEQIKDITKQRILQMKSKIRANQFDLEFSLNRLIEDENVNKSKE